MSSNSDGGGGNFSFYSIGGGGGSEISGVPPLPSIFNWNSPNYYTTDVNYFSNIIKKCIKCLNKIDIVV
jgi:hypothetical protein